MEKIRIITDSASDIPQNNPYGITVLSMSIRFGDFLAPAIEFTKKHPDKILWCGEFGTIRHADITV